jgi:hypothetical protein
MKMSNNQRKYLKALETLVYIANKDQRQYWILKTIYIADKEHLRRYGRQIFNDSYRAMKQGPVPSLAYDIIKNVRGIGWYSFSDPAPSTALQTPDNRTVIPLRTADLNLLSKTEIECLDIAYNAIQKLDFGALKELSHDSAYTAVEQDEEMSIENIIMTLENSREVLEYIQE